MFNFLKRKESKNLDAEKSAVVKRLEELGYFRYTDKHNIDEVKQEVGLFLLEKHILTSRHFDTPPFCSKDYRYYSFDGENLFEQNGFTDMLSDMKALFEKINFKLDITNHIEDWDDEKKWLNHSITINAKSYIIFKNFRGYGWGEAAQRFAEIINDQLALQDKDERLYLCNGGNDGCVIFLTSSLYNYIFPDLADPIGGFLPTDKWCKIMQVDPLKYLGE